MMRIEPGTIVKINGNYVTVSIIGSNVEREYTLEAWTTKFKAFLGLQSYTVYSNN